MPTEVIIDDTPILGVPQSEEQITSLLDQEKKDPDLDSELGNICTRALILPHTKEN